MWARRVACSSLFYWKTWIVCMCLSVCLCMCVFLCLCACACVCMSVHVCVCVCNVCLSEHVYVCLYALICVLWRLWTALTAIYLIMHDVALTYLIIYYCHPLWLSFLYGVYHLPSFPCLCDWFVAVVFAARMENSQSCVTRMWAHCESVSLTFSLLVY